ncbi:MAG: ABC transporter permease [Oscillospiraceae bacterium]|nr:ABC transporter permease [Oscillospiraceae bacterium]
MERSHSPGALTAKRFLRNKLAVAGLVVLGIMFAFSFLGAFLTPYGQDQVFYRRELQQKEYAALKENDTFRYHVAPGQQFGPVLQAQFSLKKDSFTWQDTAYTVISEEDFYTIYIGETPVALATMDILPADADFAQARQLLLAGGGERFVIRENGSIPGLKEAAVAAIEEGSPEFSLQGRQFTLSYDPAGKLWSVREETETLVWDAYAAPSAAHPLGTDKNGMDMLTRLMYGGRVSLVIGFVVVAISAALGVTLGGIAGYFGRWVDSLIMRIVDVFYCIPRTPLLIILGAAMDGMRVDPQIRMLLLMLTLGFLGWPGIARLVRGQILSLREQEFMTAAEAAGIRARHRIFRHLIPNVIPQLIVTCTEDLGSAIITEATLSFLGLGVKFPFASWGNIMNDVSNAHVLTSYWFVWIPAGICLVLAVLGFNFVGDGLRDAFDPKMKR